MRSRWLRSLLVLVFTMALTAAACGGDDNGGGGGSSPSGGTQDLLARIEADGVIRVSTDPAYPPQSYLNPDTGEYEGFDIDVATEIAKRLGVDISWEAPSWDLIIAGSWNDRWDMSVGSMTVTPERAQVLDFTPAYYYTPAVVAVHQDNTTIQNVDTDLDGKTIGVCGGCTYDYFLQKTLEIPGYTFDFVIDDANIVTYDTDSTAVQDLTLGDGTRLDAVISSETVIQGAIDKGKPIKIVGAPVFYEPLGVAFDKSAPLDPTSLVEKVSGIIDDMHADGTLSELSNKWFGVDYTVTT
jgi:polar amino acid transport system substrate-binding protein